MTESERQASRWPQAVVWVLAGIPLLAILLFLGLEIALRQERVQQAIRGRITQLVTERTGLDVGIEALRPSLLRGSVELQGLTVSAAPERPILVVERVEASVRWTSLWTRPWTLESLVVEQPRIDLGAPVPSLPGTSESGETDFALVIERFELDQGKIQGPTLPEDLQTWIESWWMEDLRLEGRYGPAQIAVDLTSQLLWRRSDSGVVQQAVEAALTGPTSGPWELQQLSIEGDGLDAKISAIAGPSAEDPVVARWDLEVQPHLLVPVPPAEGPVSIQGDLDTALKTAGFRLTGTGIPVALARPWLPADLAATPSMADWSLDVGADLAVAGDTPSLSGHVDVQVKSRDATWLQGEVEVISATPQQALARLEGSVLPGERGERSIAGLLELPDLQAVDSWSLRDGRIDVVDTDLRRLDEAIRAIWPEPLPAAIERGLVGVLDAAVTAEGSVQALQIDATSTWRDGTRANLELAASMTPDRVTVKDLQGQFGDRQFRGHGHADLPAPVESAEATLELAGLVAEVPELDIDLTLDQGVAGIQADVTTSNGVTSRWTARVPMQSLAELPEIGEAMAALPITGTTGPVIVDWQIPDADWGEWISSLRPNLPETGLRAGSRGSLQVDLAKPLAAQGRLTVDPLRIETADLEVTAESPLRLLLDRGQLVLEPTRFQTQGGSLELEAWSELADSWKPGEPLEALVRRFKVIADGLAPMALLEPLAPEIAAQGDVQLSLSLSGTPEDLNGNLRAFGPEVVLRLGGTEGIELANPELEIAFAGDRIRLEKANVQIEQGRLSATGEVPLATVVGLLEASPEAGPTATGSTPGPLRLAWELTPSEWGPSLAKLGLEEPPESLQMGSRGEISVDLARPLDARGWMEVDPLVLADEGQRLVNDGPLRVELADGVLRLEAMKLQVAEQPFQLSGIVELDRGWRTEQSAIELVRSLSVEARGTLAAALLNPFLFGGRAEGLVYVDLVVEGTPDDPRGSLRLEGPEASILYRTPYLARLENLELDVELVEGRAQVRDGRLRLNGGDVELAGSLGLDGADLFAAFDGLRFRLDHGLLVRLDGELDLVVDTEGRGTLRGEVIVDQGSLTRPITLDRDFLTDLLSPIDLTSTEVSTLEDIELDLILKTRRGVRVRNNVADLAVQWDEIRVRGNPLQPILDGQFRVEPGGRAFLFGQTLRIDRGEMTFPGQPGAEAILDLETTSSLDDPSISRLAGDDVLSLGGTEAAEDLETRARDAGWSAAAFVSEQLATKVAEAVPSARFTFRPILIFGEADPGARLTIGREFSRYVTLAASIDLRNAESQTYLMDAHDIPRLPGLVVQVFTNDLEEEGVTVQHRLRFGSHRRKAQTGPALRKLEIDAVPRVSQRALRRASGLDRGDRASLDDIFLAEVEVGEFLRTRGYPDALVEARSQPVPERPKKVDVEISIDPGPSVTFSYTGEELARNLQRSITSLYRSDFYEEAALAEMEVQAVRALRSQGFLYPIVQISVESSTSAEGREERAVSIHTLGGDQATLESLELTGLSEKEAVEVEAVFRTRLQRVELATGEPSADRRLLSAIQGLGYPAPEILNRTLSEDRNLLTVAVEPGSPRYLGSIVVQGVPVEEAQRLAGVTDLEAGAVLRRNRIATGALAIESDLRSRGFVNARVQPRLEPSESDALAPARLVYEVEPGEAYTVAETDFNGLQSTRRRWATNVAEMESGAPLREDEVAAARSRLYETGLFTMVRSDTFETQDGGTEVVFDVEERARFSTAYGIRWDSDEGAQGVVDLVDRNFLGRSVTLGLRALYKTDDWNVRLGAGVPRLFGTKAVMEIFGSYEGTFEELEDEFFISRFDDRTVEASLQVAYPFSRDVSGRFYGRYRRADLQITEIDKDPDFPLPPIELDFSFRTPILGTLWIFDTRSRDTILPRGTFASLDLSGTGDFLGSDFKYIRMFTQFNLYRPVARWRGRGFTWAQSLRLGLAESFDQELDRDDRFFAGGQYSVRGYVTDSLGPVEVLGEDLVRPLGGKTLVVINQELRFNVLGPVAGLVFLDLGNVWEDTAEFSTDLFKSLGLGLRADTPIGLLRLDLAFPLDRREIDPSSKIYFGFGNTF